MKGRGTRRQETYSSIEDAGVCLVTLPGKRKSSVIRVGEVDGPSLVSGTGFLHGVQEGRHGRQVAQSDSMVLYSGFYGASILQSLITVLMGLMCENSVSVYLIIECFP